LEKPHFHYRPWRRNGMDDYENALGKGGKGHKGLKGCKGF
jgi:hypothetical protein